MSGIAYQHKIPQNTQIHNVFHILQLKPFHGVPPMVTHIHAWLQGRTVEVNLVPEAILDGRMVKFQNKDQVRFLV